MSNSVLTERLPPAGRLPRFSWALNSARASWLDRPLCAGAGKTVSRHKVEGGDLGAGPEADRGGEAAHLRRRASRFAWCRSTRPATTVSGCIARLTAAGIENRVIDAASIPVDRRARRVKTDRLDLELLIRMLLALERGETRICRVVRVPTPVEEDVKRQHRERSVLIAERTAHSNRIAGVLMALGIRGANPRRRDFADRLETAGDCHRGAAASPYEASAGTRARAVIPAGSSDQGDRGRASAAIKAAAENKGERKDEVRAGAVLEASAAQARHWSD